ncbi:MULTISPECIES: YbhB/YbcL family Raf kinase inhibitor-like protein [Blautia]|uniref:YbhB/YbcL family Raf kinase inhibitor-like protein n=1 Tax=Blautia TaxID=572511 RepID=UPI001FA95FA0|nr:MULTISPECIES: YbhB/YbcL family Raf kinase inhibitor-like protein [Blautia]
MPFELVPKAVSVAIIMNDLDIPMVKEYTHWLIWNIPPQKEIPENIPYGPVVQELGNAVQGTAYGKNRYRGPKQPIFIRNTHRYVFRIYTLDCILKLPKDAGRKELLDAIKGHVIQEGSITGRYKR